MGVKSPAEHLADPAQCVIRIRQGERLAGKLAELLLPVDPATFHEYRLPPRAEVELHFHDVDEYWWFTAGRPRVTLRNPAGVTRVLELGPGDLVACLRGIEHTLWADHELVYFQYSSLRQGGEREGHLVR